MARSEPGTGQPMSVCVLVVLMREKGSSPPTPVPLSAFACAWPWLLLLLGLSLALRGWVHFSCSQHSHPARADLKQGMKGRNAEGLTSVKTTTST